MNRGVIPPSGGPSTSSGVGGSSLPSSSTPANNTEGRTTTTKVAEVFLTAGHAFQRLGDLTLQLQGSSEEPNSDDNNKWADADITKLRDALTRFAHELDNISDSVQQRTTKHVKLDIKRRTLQGDDSVVRRQPLPTHSSTMAMGGMGGSGGSGIGGGTMVGLKRGSHMMGMGMHSALPPAAKRPQNTPSYTKFQPYSGGLSSSSGGRMGAAASRPPTAYLTESSVAGTGPASLTQSALGGPSLSSLSSHSSLSTHTPLLSDPSHHYINSRPGNY